MASVYKRNDLYYIKFYENGKRVRRSLGTSSKRQAYKLKEQIERQLAEGKFDVNRVDTDVAVFWEEYLCWARMHKRPRTIEIETLCDMVTEKRDREAVFSENIQAVYKGKL